MSITGKVREVLEKNKKTQTWTIEKMNDINPRLKMDKDKMSSIINGKRKMTCEELLAFCMAFEISPDEFLND